MKCMRFLLSTSVAAAVLLGAVPGAMPGSVAFAQMVDDDTQPEVRLNLPSDPTIFASNPNVRRATAKINGTIITGTDIDQRLALIVYSNKTELPASELERFRAQVLANLIDETLQIQEAEAQEIAVKDKDVDDYFARIAQQNYKRSPKETVEFLASIGSSVASVKRQIKGEIAWSRLISRNVSPQIEVSDAEVTAIVERINTNKGRAEYHLGEIYLQATPETQDVQFKLVSQIMEQLKQGGSFAAYARQYSNATTAAVGGDLGWLFPEQLPDTLAQAAVGMQRGEVIVVPAPGGVSILAMFDQRQVATASAADTILSIKQLAFEFPAETSEKDFQAKANAFSAAVQEINGCGAADGIAANLGAAVVNRDGFRLGDLPLPLQQIMQTLSIGQATPAFGSKVDGVRAFVLCGRDALPAAVEVDAGRIRQDIEDKKTDKRAQLLLRDLRRDAIIEYN